MRRNRLLLLLLVALVACTSPEPKKEVAALFQPIRHTIESVPVNSSIRALEIGPDGTIWYAGSRGKFGFSSDNGKTWTHDSLQQDSLEFRSIAVTNTAVMLLSIGSPAILYRSEDRGQTWSVVYQEDHASAFYDAMTFWDEKDGIAMGDPSDGCISIILTKDGGKSWRKVACDKLPPAVDGEAAFAASNTNIVVRGNQAWIATGGSKSRIFHSKDRGESWQIFETPMNQGGAMTGMFTLAFYDSLRGITFGGDWENKPSAQGNKAVTTDGGKSWRLLTDGKGPGYRSCVQYVPGSDARSIFAVGIPGVSYSPDGGQHWQLLSEEDFYTVRIVDSVAWLAGRGKIARLQFSLH